MAPGVSPRKFDARMDDVNSSRKLLTALLVVGLSLTSCKRESEPVEGRSEDNGPRITVEYEVRPSVLFEAEAGRIEAPVAEFESDAASGGKYVLAPEGPDHQEINKGGGVNFTLKIEKAGDYWFWLRTHWSGACGNSLGVALDGQDIGAVGDATYEEWHWVRLGRKPIALAGGDHVLYVESREDGSSFDQVLLAQDEDYRPIGIEDAASEGRTVLTDCKPVVAVQVPAPPVQVLPGEAHAPR